MTTFSEPLPRAVITAGHLLRRPAVVSFGLTLVVALLALSVLATGYAHLHRDAIPPGVTVYGVAVGGLDRAAAEQRLRGSLPVLNEGALTVRFAGVEERVTYSEVGRDYDLAAMLDAAFALGRDGGAVQQAAMQLRMLTHGAAVGPLATWDEQAIERRLAEIAAAAESDPRDATVVREGGSYRVVPAEVGVSVDLQAGIAQALAAVSRTSPGDARVAVSGTQVPPRIDTALAQQAVADFERVAGRAFVAAGGGVNALIEPTTIRSWISLTDADGGWEVTIDSAAITAHVARYAEQINREPVDATFQFRDEGGVTAIAGVVGQTFDVAATAGQIVELLEARAAGGNPTGVHMAVSLVEPEITTAYARDIAARVVNVSSWTTRFTPGESNFNGRNIAIPAEILNGHVVAPGERFSFIEQVFPLTRERGFGPGGAIIRGRTESTGAMGGGICAASTTLFNAALRAGYEIKARTQHSYHIDRYPVGLDATVWRSGGSTRDMVFVNDSEYPLWIRGVNKRGRVTFEIWTVPDGRTVEIGEPRVWDRTRPGETIEHTDALRPGQRVVVEKPVAGFKSSVTRVVRDANGRVLHEDTFRSNYITIDAIIQVGQGSSSDS